MKEGLSRNISQCFAYTIKHDGPLRWSNLLGFTKEEFIKHLEENFTDNMSWDNYGDWVVSYRIPRRCYNFNSIRDDDFRLCFSLKNICPKWYKDAQHTKKQISKSVLNKYGLWDILPKGNVAQMLVD